MSWTDGIVPPGDFKLHSFTKNAKGDLTSERHVRAGRPASEVIKVPDPAAIARTSTLYDTEGQVRAQWVIEKPEDKARQQAIEAWLDTAMANIPVRPLMPTLNAHTLDDDLLAEYPVGDHHLGMLAWKHEVGVSNDIELSEEILTKAMSYLVQAAPPATYAIIELLGDFFHTDSFVSLTPTNRNPLDSDGRAPKMIDAGMRLVERIIEFAAQKHRFVHVIVELGNHDTYTSMILARMLDRLYRGDARVTIDINPSHFHYYEFGKVLIGTHHGNGRAAKPAQLPQIMAADRREAWGRTEHHYWRTGHIHQQTVYEFPGCVVESFPILPPGDAYSFNEGYRSRRLMRVITQHRQYGEVGRVTVNPNMLEKP